MPSVDISAATHPVAGWRSIVSGLVSLCIPAFIGLLVYADAVFAALDMPVPPTVVYLANNKLISIMVMYFVANSVASSLTSTGAFEIYVDGTRVYSKLESGAAPSIPQALDLIAKALSPAATAHHQLHSEELL